VVYRQSVLLSNNPLETRDMAIYFSQLNTCGYILYVTSSLTRGWVCHLQLLLVLASTVILRSESCGTHDHILLSQIREPPNLEGQVPVFITTRLYPQTLGSLLVTSYDSQGYGGCIRHCLHMCPTFITLGRTEYRSPPPTVPLLFCVYSLLWKHVLIL
jgi:hypothetical protein